ncbi:MAG TPA: SDR family NAD(P)-dependent oxidoreductase [Thermoanaerobaculia bacterium]|nr:SDR family NAD(P)-dependent oxidoreductase [Thermoanaerobaculia bacterium]
MTAFKRMKLNGKTVVVTGASSGIGRAVSIELAKRGATLFLAARRADQLESVAALCREHGVAATPVVTDVSDRSSCEKLIATAGRVDVLINNAGFATFDVIETADPDDLESMMRTNYFGTVWCTQAVLPQMLSRGDGTIVNVASIAGIMGYARMGGYCATKFAIIGFTEALRDEVLGRGVRVGMVCPGTTETEFFAKAERGKMPGASRLILGVSAERVARVICRTAGDGAYRRILPPAAALYMRMKEIFPRFAHLLMRRVSALLER